MMTMFMPGHGHHVPQPLAMTGGALPDSAYPDAQLAVSPTPLMGTVSDTQAIGRKRHASGDVVERMVERRQKRMIKNRESAARSRPRKQVGFWLPVSFIVLHAFKFDILTFRFVIRLVFCIVKFSF